MASRTVVDSVERVTARPDNRAQLDAQLDALRARYPGAVFERYLADLPVVAQDAHVCATAVVVGRVELGPQSSVWYGCVLRGDVNRIVVGARSNLQDGTVVHLGDRDPTVLEEDVVVGHRAVLHGCTVEAGSLIGIQATVLDGARVGRGSVIGAGAVVTAGQTIPPYSLVLGVPGKVVKSLNSASEDDHRRLAAKYCRMVHNYRFG